MQSNITEQQYFGGDLQLTAPHFDEEATVLAARPVLPLESVRKTRAGARSTRHLAFGLSILASLIVGAMGATLIDKQRGQEAAAVIVNAAVPGSGAITPERAVTASATGEAKGDLPEGEAWSANAPAVDKKPEPRITRVAERAGVTRKAASVKAAARQEEPGDQIDERDMRQMDEREMRRAERIEAKRLRRRAEREGQSARGQRREASDDLLRIREIFEGPGRP